MRLGSKIFLTCAVIITLLGGVTFFSLRAIGRLVSVNREVVTQAVPAVGVSASIRDGLVSLARIELRYLVLHDQSYVALWEERARRTQEDLERLRGYTMAPRAATLLEDTLKDFDAYRRLVVRERELMDLGRRSAALALADGDGRTLLDRMDASIEAWATARHAAVLAARRWRWGSSARGGSRSG